MNAKIQELQRSRPRKTATFIHHPVATKEHPAADYMINKTTFDRHVSNRLPFHAPPLACAAEIGPVASESWRNISQFDSFPRPSLVTAFLVTGLHIQKQGLVDGGIVTPMAHPLESRWATEARFGVSLFSARADRTASPRF